MLPMRRQDQLDYPGKESKFSVPNPYIWLFFSVGVPVVMLANAVTSGSIVKIIGAAFNATFWGLLLGAIAYAKFIAKMIEYREIMAEIIGIRHEYGAWTITMYAPEYDRIIYATAPGTNTKIMLGKKIPVILEVEKRKYLEKVENVRFHSFINTADITTE